MRYLLAILALLASPIAVSAQGSKVSIQCLTGVTGFPWDNCSAANPFPVTVISGGGGGGSISNASSGVAPTSTNAPVVGYNYVWNGASWDQAAPLLVGTIGVPSAQYVSVQGPASGGGFPTAATGITGNSTGTTGAVVGTLTGVSAKTTYICGFNVSAIGGVATIGPITVAGLTGSSQVYQVPVNAATGQVLITQNFNPCIPASATATSITVTTTADGTATAVDVNSWGYQQ